MGRTIRLIAATACVLGITAPIASAAKTVDVDDDVFSPTELTIKQNKTVDFNWVGVNEHNVFKEDGPGKYFSSRPMKGSGVLYSRKFKKPGKYLLGCILHKDMDMSLKVKKKRRR